MLSKVSQHFQRLLQLLTRLRLRESWISRSIHQYRAAVPLKHQALAGDFDGGDLVGGG